ncbi:Hypothetical predicted protein [Octopus vulgaris]|uniref:Uncharacterized protein n=1 Tax=Octopus vulgaris TaxID=6645 RepID=A0AA36F0N6_OCTVU|nr:Hypothetical predicted protein [Octopus vulgaris]
MLALLCYDPISIVGRAVAGGGGGGGGGGIVGGVMIYTLVAVMQHCLLYRALWNFKESLAPEIEMPNIHTDVLYMNF